MYLPSQFESDNAEHAADLIGAHPLATLVSCDDQGDPYISHLPLHLERTGDQFVLLGHFARGNPHWRLLESLPRAQALFMGPHAYLSPKVYPDLVRVPTWNYLAVHCRGEVRLIDEPEAKDRLLKRLIGDHEPPYAAQWRGLEPGYTGKMLSGIVGFELPVRQWVCKLKLNQHRSEAHAAMLADYAVGNDNERALADWMRRLNMGNPAPDDH